VLHLCMGCLAYDHKHLMPGGSPPAGCLHPGGPPSGLPQKFTARSTVYLSFTNHGKPASLHNLRLLVAVVATAATIGSISKLSCNSALGPHGITTNHRLRVSTMVSSAGTKQCMLCCTLLVLTLHSNLQPHSGVHPLAVVMIKHSVQAIAFRGCLLQRHEAQVRRRTGCCLGRTAGSTIGRTKARRRRQHCAAARVTLCVCVCVCGDCSREAKALPARVRQAQFGWVRAQALVTFNYKG